MEGVDRKCPPYDLRGGLFTCFVMAGGVWWSERTVMIFPEEGRKS